MNSKNAVRQKDLYTIDIFCQRLEQRPVRRPKMSWNNRSSLKCSNSTNTKIYAGCIRPPVLVVFLVNYDTGCLWEKP